MAVMIAKVIKFYMHTSTYTTRRHVCAPGCMVVNNHINKHVMYYGNVLTFLCADGAEPPTSCGGSREEAVCVCVCMHASRSCARTEDLPSWGQSRVLGVRYCFFPSSWPWTCVSSPLTKYADTSGMCFSCGCVICCGVYRVAYQ